MTAVPGKAPKKIKEKKQTPEERLAAMRYNHMMYGQTPNELKYKPKPVDYGAPFLKHPKFQSLMTAFRNGNEFKFDISTDGKMFTIATDGTHISFGGRTICYARSLNRHEDNLLLDRAAAILFQANEAVVHLVFAVLRSFPELPDSGISYLRHKFYQGSETLESAGVQEGSNLLLGAFAHNKTHERKGPSK